MKYNVKHNHSAYRPHSWSGNYVRTFGKRNEGFTVNAESIEHAKQVCRNTHNLNPFYLTISELS